MNEILETQEVPEGTAPEMATPAKKKRVTVGDVDTKLKELDSFLDEDVIPAIDQLEIQMQASEERTAKHNDTLLSDVKTRLDIIDKSMQILSDNQSTLMKQHLERDARMEEIEDMLMAHETDARDRKESAEHTELEFAQPPSPHARQRATAGDIETVASVCLTMTDILTICRALKEAPDLDDQDKIRILNIACKTAGEMMTHGMLIRAGISATEAAGGR